MVSHKHDDTKDACMNPHQPGQAVFRSILPEDID